MVSYRQVFSFVGLLLILNLFFWVNVPSVLADVERTPLTLDLLDKRLNSPQLEEGVLTIDFSYLTIDLTPDNSDFSEQFYRKLQNRLNHSDKVLGLNFSHSFIQGDLISSRFGISTILSPEALPQNLTIIERKIIEESQQFSDKTYETRSSIILLRGPLKFNEALVTGNFNFKNTFLLQKLEAQGSKLTQEVNFNQAIFGRKVYFTEAVFQEKVDFSRMEFQDKVKFNKAKFQGESRFNDSQFKNNVDFEQAEFDKVANFSNTSWSNQVNFSGINGQDCVLFSGNIFSHSVNFSNATFEKSIAFRKTYFRELLNLKDVKILGLMDFSNAEFFRNRAINISGFAFDSDGAKLLGNTGNIGKFMYLNNLEGNETVLRNLIQNFRNLEQISDANQLEYKTKKLKKDQIASQILKTHYQDYFQLNFIQKLGYWSFLNILLLLSHYGTNFTLILGIGLISIGYFGLLFWLIDRWRRRFPKPILPSRYDLICMISSCLSLVAIGTTEIFNSAEYPLITLVCLSLILGPIPLSLIVLIYQKGRYHDLMETSYFLLDGGFRQLQLLIVRLPVIPEFHFFRDRYTPLVWERRWNWLNYYDFSLNNFLKLGFNDIRLRDQHLPGFVSTLVWYQWMLGILYIALLFWTLSRTIPGLNLLIYLK